MTHRVIGRWLGGVLAFAVLAPATLSFAADKESVKKVAADQAAEKAKAERLAKELIERRVLPIFQQPVPAPFGEVEKPSSGPASPSSSSTTPAPIITAAPRAPVMNDQEIRLLMNDGAVLTGKLSTSSILVNTEYGPLTIPIRSIVHFTPGLDSQTKLKAKVNELVEKLGDKEFAARQQAQGQLLALGPRIRPALATYTTVKDAERLNRIKAVLKTFDEMLTEMEEDEEVNVDDHVMRVEDVIKTTSFTVWGKITNESFKLDSRYGLLNIDLADIRRAERDMGQASEISKKVEVAGRNQTYGEWASTGITVNRGDRISITAKGSITMTPWGSNRVSTPDGCPNCGSFNGHVMGALVARIGSSDKWVKIGRKSTFVADRAGKLELAVAIQANWKTYSFPGEYDTSVKVKRAGEE